MFVNGSTSPLYPRCYFLQKRLYSELNKNPISLPTNYHGCTLCGRQGKTKVLMEQASLIFASRRLLPLLVLSRERIQETINADKKETV